MPFFEVAIILALILLNGFFAMAELAVVSARQARLQLLAKDGKVAAERALDLAQDPSRFLSAVQIGITLIGILTGAFGGATLADYLATWLRDFPAFAPYATSLSVGIVVVIITYLSLILGELVPKRIALASPERIAMFVARPLGVIAFVARPVVSLLSVSGSIVLSILRIRESGKDAVTEEEVRTVIAEGTAAGAIDPVEHRMLESVLRLADRPVRAIMVPRPDVFWVDLDDDEETIRQELLETSASRIVVARDGNLQEPLGVVRKKDLLAAVLSGRRLDIEKTMIQPLYVPEGISVLRLLDLYKTQPAHIAFVVDEFGSFEGLVTPTDVLEAIAGDLAVDHAARDIQPRGDGSYLVDGGASVDDLHGMLGMRIDEDREYHTAAGLVLDALGRIPNEADEVEINGWTIEVVDMDSHRIDKLLFTPIEPDESDDAST